jgi:hypothetical protein
LGHFFMEKPSYWLKSYFSGRETLGQTVGIKVSTSQIFSFILFWYHSSFHFCFLSQVKP